MTENRTWTIRDAHLPDSLEGWRVLEVGGVDDHDRYLQLGASEIIHCEVPPSPEDGPGKTFELIRYTRATPSPLHPMTALSLLWQVAAPGATLLLDSPMLDDVTDSQYARFAPSLRDETDPQWLPGRLTLRWMVEVSGFDVSYWLGERPGEWNGGTTASTFLQAVRTARRPALDPAQFQSQ